MLNYQIYGEDLNTPPLIIAHGLFGSARNWGVIAKRLSDIRQVVAVDMRNHGQSPHHDTHDYPAMADDLAAVIRHLGGTADVLGHSMGGKASMVLALTQPDIIRHLIVVDIAPVAYTHPQLPYLKAMQSVDLSTVTRRSDADAQLMAAVPDPSLRSFLAQSLEISDGVARWRLNLPVLAAEMDKVMSFPRVEGQFSGRVDFVVGGASTYVDDANWKAAQDLFPMANIHTIEGAGHWVHAEAPRPFEAAVRHLLSN